LQIIFPTVYNLDVLYCVFVLILIVCCIIVVQTSDNAICLDNAWNAGSQKPLNLGDQT